MQTLEEIWSSFFEDKDWINKIIIGGLLCFIPILNIFAFGLLYRFAKQIKRTKRYNLPEWDKWPQLFIEGLYFLLLGFIFMLFPLLIGLSLSKFLLSLTGGFLGFLAYTPFSIATILSPALMVSALFHFQPSKDWQHMLDFVSLFKGLKRLWPRLVVPSFFSLGIVLVGSPLYGFAFFLAFSFMIYYYGFLIRSAKNQ